MSEEKPIRVTLEQDGDYAFRVSFDDTLLEPMLTDESYVRNYYYDMENTWTDDEKLEKLIAHEAAKKASQSASGTA